MTAGGTVGVITIPPEARSSGAAIVILEDFCVVWPEESVKATVKLDVSACVGVPAKTPDVAFRLRPGAGAPPMFQV